MTTANFDANLDTKKFSNIKCCKADLKLAATVIVATVRAMNMNS